jgi:hypothetical protein
LLDKLVWYSSRADQKAFGVWHGNAGVLEQP